MREPLIDHLTVPVRDFEVSKRFYLRALEPFGARMVELEGAAGFGSEGNEDFWVAPGEPAAPVHLAFAARDRATVDAFHAVATAVGGRNNGPPGLRPQYHEHYYAAYVIDPDGWLDTFRRECANDGRLRGRAGSTSKFSSGGPRRSSPQTTSRSASQIGQPCVPRAAVDAAGADR
jgi:catechol 2,3-dioxygenase-like lactoylglutathione lyase family enzyme